MKQRIYTLVLTAAMLLAVLPVQARAAENFVPSAVYENQFSDVAASDWYYEDVKALYELGLAQGKGDGDLFDPNGALTVAEVITMASRLRSLYETGSSESARDTYGIGGGEWYLPYLRHLVAEGIIGEELKGTYDRPATRAEMAHVLAGALPQELLDPINRETVSSGYDSGRYIQDVKEDTPYQDDILLLYDWGVAGGSDDRGSFYPDSRIVRSEAAAMVARLAYPALRMELDWDILPSYSMGGSTLEAMVKSDGTFYPSPALDNREELDADVRCMLANGERTLSLEYPEGTVTRQFVNELMNAFLSVVRNYVEQTYNNVTVLYYPNSKNVEITFSSSLYDESQIERYREETMEYAIAVHDQMWAEGRITEDMSEYEKARVYFTWICDHCRYDHGNSSMSHSGYQAFATGLAVCDGYTAAYNLLLKLEGIECGTYSTAKHIWTVAELDGETYHIDTTWGDQRYGVEYEYFAMTEAKAVGRF